MCVHACLCVLGHGQKCSSSGTSVTSHPTQLKPRSHQQPRKAACPTHCKHTAPPTVNHPPCPAIPTTIVGALLQRCKRAASNKT